MGDVRPDWTVFVPIEPESSIVQLSRSAAATIATTSNNCRSCGKPHVAFCVTIDDLQTYALVTPFQAREIAMKLLADADRVDPQVKQ